MTTWWLDELTNAGSEHLDAAVVDGQDAKQRFDPSADVALLAEHGLGPGSRLVDLGAGTRTLSIAAADTGARAVAADVSPAMVARLAERCAAMPNVMVVCPGLLSNEPVDEELLDFVYCRNVLHRVPDFWKVMALRCIAGWLRPGGIAQLRDLVYDMAPDEVEPVFEAWFDQAVDDPARGYTAGDFAEHVRSEHSTFTWLLEPMRERTGFTIVERSVRGGVYAAYTGRRRWSSAHER